MCVANSKRYDHSFCSFECYLQFRSDAGRIKLPCTYCGKEVFRTKSQFARSKGNNVFCNKSCAASFNNTLKRKSRRSRCEKLLYDLLEEEFPDLKILPNDKTMINGYELDIAIPSLNLAIEWNGIVHFKPIYGQAKLDKIQQRDTEKQQKATDRGINLIVVPDLVSTDKRVREAFVSISKTIRQLL